MSESLESLERRLEVLERRNNVLALLLFMAIGLGVTIGCQKSQQSVYSSPGGESKLVISAEGLSFQDDQGRVKAELSPERLTISGPSERRVQLSADSVSAGLNVFRGDQVLISLWSGEKEAQFSVHDTSNSRRASLVTNASSSDFYIAGPDDATSVHLMCRDGVARVVQVPGPE